jgi:rhodanese-related sulfurtransferase
MNQAINFLMISVMAGLLGYFLYSEGWILSDFKNLSPQEANYLIENDTNITLIDVRSRAMYKKDFIEGAINVPMTLKEQKLSRFDKFKDTKLLLYSERDEKSMEVARLLTPKGFKILVLKGGVVFWIRTGYVVSQH